MMLSVAARECIQFLTAVRGYSPATATNYDRTYHQFLAYLRAQGLPDACAAFTTSNVMGFFSDLGARGVHVNTIANKRHALSTLARHLLKRKDGRGRPLLASNVALECEAPREVQPKTEFLHADELRKLLAVAVSPEMHVVREVLVDTMIRRQEAVEANVGNLREQDGSVYLDVLVKGRRGSGAEPRSIPLSPYVVQVIQDSLLRRGLPGPLEALLVDERGDRFTVSQLTNRFERLGRKAGITRIMVSPHKLRHTSATLAWAATKDRVLLANMLNHQGTRHVERYTHLVPGATVAGRVAQREAMRQYVSEERP